jgi:flagellar motor switch protein FliN
MSSSPTSSSSSELSLPPALVSFGDVRMHVDVLLGKGSMTLRACLGLQRGSVVRLSQSAGQDLFVLVNDIPVARGEVVIIDDSVSLRLTEFRQKAATEALA